jgi:hypothetical protein
LLLWLLLWLQELCASLLLMRWLLQGHVLPMLLLQRSQPRRVHPDVAVHSSQQLQSPETQQELQDTVVRLLLLLRLQQAAASWLPLRILVQKEAAV